MEWSIPVFRGGREAAQLRCTGDGLRTGFFLSCPWMGDGVEKLWLEGSGRYLLGTPVPKAGGLTLRRVVSNRQLEGIRPIERGVLVGAEEQPLPKEIVDPELCSLLAGSGYACAPSGECLLLSWPWNPGAPLPVPALATLMSWQEGKLVLKLKNGWPVVGR